MATSRQVPTTERQWLRVLGTLNEMQARVFVAQRALEEGRGGVSRLARLTGMSRPTILKGIADLQGKVLEVGVETGRIRQPGGGRKPVEAVAPALERALDRILAETTAGDPMSALRWTNKSTRTLAAELTRQGHAVSHVTVARCLHEMGYSLQANVKAVEGTQHPDRDAQFRYINQHVSRFLRRRDPVVSVDMKKKELVGAFGNRGRRWIPRGEPERVFVHDFPHLGKGKAIPYGTYDVARDEALVNVGITHETAEFAVESIRRWWRLLGRKAYPPGRAPADLRRCGRQQREPAAGVESSPAASLGPSGSPDHRLPLPTGHEQVEQDRASPLLVHQPELEGAAADQFRSGGEPHWQHHHAGRTQSQGAPGYHELRAGAEDSRCGHAGPAPQAPYVPRGLELHTRAPTLNVVSRLG